MSKHRCKRGQRQKGQGLEQLEKHDAKQRLLPNFEGCWKTIGKHVLVDFPGLPRSSLF